LEHLKVIAVNNVFINDTTTRRIRRRIKRRVVNKQEGRLTALSDQFPNGRALMLPGRFMFKGSAPMLCLKD